ncbi:4'-phosphopantetheinyl transferase family protein [Catenuloplanes atrovinosus]|uniref:4'-phosphopantetheinyl transferase EntD n=1 Tax=Catenuloplanes atrovinosus TaxID=137266 RepID=A0AAE3YQ10_9ACTN|nr:4'-phosphopantetheinyl transferase superfamily protein [Catenuloplanes atrovinosus]MDR7276505.1 4'-phosphopantetheinyl transferase EntD [Catenuloplanes atrovinosus]
MIERLLPPGIAWAETFGDEDCALFPAEEAAIARAVDKRRREFVTARWCARRALATLGLPPSPIVPGERGAPGWPPGVVGAITHCPGYRAAVAARTPAVRSVGVDAELHEPLPDGVLDLVSVPEERAWLAAAPAGTHWDRLLFSAKESVYKAWFPLARRWLGFEEARLTALPDGTFHADLLVDGPVTAFSGRWLTADGLILTAIVHTRA